ncbi:hypothetical protein AB0M94_38695 [Streptomyces xanthochromogenes]|uniref:hypothetical protein n=1 Tax=Streptomyces xanthochromogenes TaxID=67384 RepID=UPI003448FD12
MFVNVIRTEPTPWRASPWFFAAIRRFAVWQVDDAGEEFEPPVAVPDDELPEEAEADRLAAAVDGATGDDGEEELPLTSEELSVPHAVSARTAASPTEVATAWRTEMRCIG